MSNDGFESMISSVIGNEELMNKISSALSSHNGDTSSAIPEVMEMISSSIGTDKSSSQEAKRESSELGKGSLDFSKNLKLLLALKPFLSEKRAQRIDNILKFEKIAEIIKFTR